MKGRSVRTQEEVGPAALSVMRSGEEEEEEEEE